MSKVQTRCSGPNFPFLGVFLVSPSHPESNLALLLDQQEFEKHKCLMGEKCLTDIDFSILVFKTAPIQFLAKVPEGKVFQDCQNLIAKVDTFTLIYFREFSKKHRHLQELDFVPFKPKSEVPTTRQQFRGLQNKTKRSAMSPNCRASKEGTSPKEENAIILNKSSPQNLGFKDIEKKLSGIHSICLDIQKNCKDSAKLNKLQEKVLKLNAQCKDLTIHKESLTLQVQDMDALKAENERLLQVTLELTERNSQLEEENKALASTNVELERENKFFIETLQVRSFFNQKKKKQKKNKRKNKRKKTSNKRKRSSSDSS